MRGAVCVCGGGGLCACPNGSGRRPFPVAMWRVLKLPDNRLPGQWTAPGFLFLSFYHSLSVSPSSPSIRCYFLNVGVLLCAAPGARVLFSKCQKRAAPSSRPYARQMPSGAAEVKGCPARSGSCVLPGPSSPRICLVLEPGPQNQPLKR